MLIGKYLLLLCLQRVLRIIRIYVCIVSLTNLEAVPTAII
jgi:hypothetical protein